MRAASPRRLLVLAALLALAASDGPPRVELFSPVGTVEGAEQVRIRFSESMVTLGDPRAPAPATGQCAPGQGRWVDTREWAFDFAAPLPGGLSCRFTLNPGLKTLGGEAIGGATSFQFNTGGPTLLESEPSADRTVDEDQVFALGLNAQPTAASVAANARCVIEGVGEAVPFDALPEDKVRPLIAAADRSYNLRYFLERAGWRKPQYDDGEGPRRRLALVFGQCRRALPAGAKVSVIWGAGIASPAGLATTEPSRIDVTVREPFSARFSCSRVNAAARCSPVEPLSLRFSAPVPAALAAQIRLTGADRQSRAPDPIKPTERTVQQVTFKPPFPGAADWQITLPSGLTDEAGRTLSNAQRFPLAVRTDEAPPLAKFAGTFGILEAEEGGVLPVTLRNVEPTLGARVQPVSGRTLRLGQSDGQVAQWLRTLEKAEERTSIDVPIAGTDRTRSIETTRQEPLIRQDAPARTILVPKPGGAKAFEVVGIPLKEPGFYVVELASPRLGAALLGPGKVRYVATGALVTNMSVHFAWGRGQSLAWVTRLSDGKPVGGAAVQVTDSCSGALLGTGRTDSQGRAAISGLPEPQSYTGCDRYADSHPLMVSARADGDYSFTLTSWNNGIQPSDFRLDTGYGFDRAPAHTVFDRTLIRAGETIHMKHILRTRGDMGFGFPAPAAKPQTLVIRHLGSDTSWKQPVRIGADGIGLSDWAAPKEAALGDYSVEIDGKESGRFSVEEFRLPTMRAEVRGPGRPVVNARQVPLDLSLSYYNGGAAGGAPVTLRSRAEPRAVSIRDYPDFSWTAERIVEGVVAQGTEGDEADSEDGDGESAPPPATAAQLRATVTPLTLDARGEARAAAPAPAVTNPMTLLAEMDYDDANGERRTASARIALEPASVRVGIRGEGWIQKSDDVRLKLVVLDLNDRPVAGVPVAVQLFSRETYSYRKRLIGGFYAYDNSTETKRLGASCSGRSDRLGYVTCALDAGVSGEVIALASVKDPDGNVARATSSLYLAGDDDWWFGGDNGDRMDLLPERPEYRTGETARFQVRMPFRSATALVTVASDGVMDSFVTELSGKEPVVEVKMKPGYSPNVYISVLAVRGRVAGWRLWLADLARRWGLPEWLAPREAAAPTALVDLAKPSYRLGMAKVRVGWDEHRLAVRVTPSGNSFRVRQQAQVAIAVTPPPGRPLPRDAEIAVAAVDEALLGLKPNDSWDVLPVMMAERPTSVFFSTAQTQVVGKRHYGLKAVAAGGGGGFLGAPPRADFQPLLLWRGRVPLDPQGRAALSVPLNDSLSSFRIVAVATAGADLFGTGSANVATTQELVLLSGLPPVVRTGDRYEAQVTLRNTTDKPVRATLRGSAGAAVLPALTADIPAASAHAFAWTVTAPPTEGEVRWRFAAAAGSATDSLEVGQTVAPAVPVQTWAATLAQVTGSASIPVAPPADALPGRGGVTVALARSLAGSLEGARDYARLYPYDCIEQRLSIAVILNDRARWDAAMRVLPRYLDEQGLVRFFPADWIAGDDSLTAYILTLSGTTGWDIPDGPRGRMVEGLKRIVRGGGRSHENVLVAEKGVGIIGRANLAGDLALRRIAAIAALARVGEADAAMLELVAADPNAWPTATVADWLDALGRLAPASPAAAQASAVLRARLDSQGTALSLTRPDAMWWLLGSPDATAARLLLATAQRPDWAADAPRIARGLMVRTIRGRFDTTISNALATVALARFSARFEAVPVTGQTRLALGTASRAVQWGAEPSAPVAFPWPGGGRSTLLLSQQGSGAPWATVTTRAAVPLTKPYGSGFAVRRTITPVTQAESGRWSRGDVYRVRIEVDTRSDANWTVIDDPVPAGATVLGGSLGGRSAILDEQGASAPAGPQPVFVERKAEAVRAWFDWVPRGRIAYEYTVRLGAPGRFSLPPTRVEAMYVPGMIALVPNAAVEVQP